MKKLLGLLIIMTLLFTGCGSEEVKEKEKVAKEKEIKVVTITKDEVKDIIDNYIDYPDVDIVDVRTEEEYNEGHIAGSINIPMEHLDEIHVSTSRQIIVYCNSGYQSRQAAIRLTELGYKDVKDMGGINNWEYDLESFEE